MKNEGKRGIKIMPKWYRKQKMSLNYIFLMVLSKAMVFKDTWFQKLKEIINKCDRKPGPKKM